MRIPIKVLLVEDSENDAMLVVREMNQGGFNVSYERVDSSEQMTTALDERKWDLIICDYSMPNFSGTAALHLLKAKGLDIPFIYVSGTIGEESAVEAMKVGASDYVLKGNLKRLLPAIERELREVVVRRERKEAEEALIRSEARYKELVENAIYGIYRSNVFSKFEDVNPALVTMLGYGSKEELLAVDLDNDIYCNAGETSRILEQYRTTHRVEGIEVEWRRKDRSRIKVRLSGRLVMDERKSVEGFECIVEDVTNQRALEKQINTLQKFEVIGQLAGGIAHDFNNVLGAIMGWAEIGLIKDTSGEAANEYFLKIRDQGRRAAGLTRQLLAFARRQVLASQNIILNEVVTETLSFLQKLIGEHIEVKMCLASDLRAVSADPTQIEQILINLCLNARDAMPKGGQLLIETLNFEIDEDFCQRHKFAQTGNYILLQVSDTGIGMEKETLDHMFEPFYTTKEVGKGTGLGLATIYGIVKQHSGFIHVYSELGQGTSFRIYFPATAASPRPAKAIEEGELKRGTETILVAEDYESLRDMANSMLQKLGYKVLMANDGEDALRIFKENSTEIDLVLLDVVMPKMMGVEVFTQISAISPRVPVILTTGYSAEIALLNSVTGKGVPILQKPYSIRALGQKIREVLD